MELAAITVVLALILLLLFLVLIVAMFVSLAKQGDERRRMIVQKASANTFAITVLYLLFCIVEGVVRSATKGEPLEGISPLVTLTIISIVYAVELFYFKRKYGD